MRRVWDWLSGRPYLLLTLTMLMWGGNAVASRLAVGEISPMAFTFLRWTLPVAILAFALGHQLLAHRHVLVERWPLVLLMGTLGLTVFNALMYVAAHITKQKPQPSVSGANERTFGSTSGMRPKPAPGLPIPSISAERRSRRYAPTQHSGHFSGH